MTSSVFAAPFGDEGSPTRPQSEVGVTVLLSSSVEIVASFAGGGTVSSLDAIMKN